MATPQITLRVPPDVLDAWRKACERNQTNVSEQIRLLMTSWTNEN